MIKIIENNNNKMLVIIDKVAAWLILNLVKAVSYINNGNVVVALDGPPFVINQIISNMLNDSKVPTKPKTNKTFLRFGNVIKRNCWTKFAPSTLDASYTSMLIELSPERIINAKKGLHLHEFIRTKLIKALLGELKKPVASSNNPISIKTEFITPLLLLNINFQITTTTTVGIINDKIIQLANWIILSFIIPTVVVVVIWKLMLSSSSGVINSVLIDIGLLDEATGFFSSPNKAFISLVLINSWRWSPFLALIILSGLNSISIEVYDASKVDGANFVQQFLFITFPNLKNVLFVLGLVGTLLSFNIFDIIWLITKGGPSSATTTLPLLIYETAFTKFRISQAATLSIITSILLLLFSIIFIKSMAPKEDD